MIFALKNAETIVTQKNRAVNSGKMEETEKYGKPWFFRIEQLKKILVYAIIGVWKSF